LHATQVQRYDGTICSAGRTCDAVVYGPAMNTHCTALEGWASVRISNSRG